MQVIGDIRTEGRCAERHASPLATLGLAILAVLSFKVFLSLQVGSGELEAALADLSHAGAVGHLLAEALSLDTLSSWLVAAIEARIS